MQCASAIAIDPCLEKAAQSAFEQAARQMSGPINLVIVFLCDQRNRHDELESIARGLESLAGPAPVVGMTGEGVVGSHQEVERTTAASVMVLGGIREDFNPFPLQFDRTSDGPSIFGLPDQLLDGPRPSGMLLLADPFSFPIEVLFDRLQQESPGLEIVGGYASGARQHGENGLIFRRHVFHQGAIGVLLPDSILLKPIVSQGCRPIGPHWVVTASDGNMILGLGGKPALPQLRALFQESPAREQAMMQEALFLGRAISEYQDHSSHGNFLIRNVYGIDDQRDGIVVDDAIRIGHSVRFHLRDHESASADLQSRLSHARQTDIHQEGLVEPLGCLLFSCNGRGSRLFRQPDHDARTIQTYFPKVPLSGMFAAGEFGPVGGQNFVHGFTAVAGMLYAKP